MRKRLDEIDMTLIERVQAEGRITFSRLSEIVGRSVPAVSARVNRLEVAGVIRGYEAIVAPNRLGYRVTAFVWIELLEGSNGEDVARALSSEPGVMEMHAMKDRALLVVKVRAETDDHVQALLEAILDRPEIAQVSVDRVERTYRESRRLPLSGGLNGAMHPGVAPGANTKNS